MRSSTDTYAQYTEGKCGYISKTLSTAVLQCRGLLAEVDSRHLKPLFPSIFLKTILESYLKKLILNCTKTIYVFKKISYSVVKECYACILQQPKQNS